MARKVGDTQRFGFKLMVLNGTDTTDGKATKVWHEHNTRFNSVSDAQRVAALKYPGKKVHIEGIRVKTI